MTTIYTSKKTGATYTNLTALENGKFQLTSTEDPTDVITTTESVLKRWYKKSVEVDFTSAAPAPKKNTRKASSKKVGKKTTRKARNPYSTVKSVEEITAGSFIPFYPRPTMSIQVVGLDAARDLFPGMELDHNSALLSSESFRKPRRAYVNAVTGNVGIRFNNQLLEISGLKAYI